MTLVKICGICDVEAGIAAAEALDSGRAGEVLERWVKVSQAVAV